MKIKHKKPDCPKYNQSNGMCNYYGVLCSEVNYSCDFERKCITDGKINSN